MMSKGILNVSKPALLKLIQSSGGLVISAMAYL